MTAETQGQQHGDGWDLLVVGAGPGGYVAAIRAAQLGFKVACVEQRQALGGTCLNEGCIPSKALLESSWLYHRAASGDLAAHGIDIPQPQLNLEVLQARKDKLVGDLTKGIASLFRKYKVKRITGRARLVDSGTIEVVDAAGESQRHSAKRILLATGGQAVEIPSLQFDGERVIDAKGALSLTRVPEHLLVVGAGAIGMELGSVWRRLGAQVTIVEALPEILPGLDVTLLRHAKRLFKKQGFQFKTGCRVVGSQQSGEGVTLTLENAKGESETLTGDRVLVAVGRRPAHGGLGAVELGVQLDQAGRMVVDGDYQTTLPGVYGVGDLISGPMLAHKAMAEAVVAVERMAGRDAKLNAQHIPQVVYTHPEVAMTGLTEGKAKEQGFTVKTGQFSFLANGRAKAAGDADGVAKVVMDADSGRLLGVHLLGPQASELISQAVPALDEGWTLHRFVQAIQPHPTLSEALKEAALAALGEAVHM
ncbi:MAG: dihydrolipoyl dehydrogenase [Magnetococcales bacterium]|nr:dihydrolipoyl dehydrogenase [Magnetococcales bacterium]